MWERGDGDSQIIVGLLAGSDEEEVDRRHTFETLLSFCRDELRCAKPRRFSLLLLGAGEHNNLHAHLTRELHGQVTQPAETDDANSHPGLDAVLVQRTPDRRAAAHQRADRLALQRVGNLVQRRHVPAPAGGKEAFVRVRAAIRLLVLAVHVDAGQAVAAAAAVFLDPAHADAVADLQVADGAGRGAQGSDDAHPLVAQAHAGFHVVQVRAAEAAVGEFDVGVCGAKLPGRFAGAEGARGRTLDDGEGVRL